MAAASDLTLVGTFASQHDAEAAKERLETHGVGPTTVEEDADGVWTVHAPADRKQEALEQLQILEQRRRGPAVSCRRTPTARRRRESEVHVHERLSRATTTARAGGPHTSRPGTRQAGGGGCAGQEA